MEVFKDINARLWDKEVNSLARAAGGATLMKLMIEDQRQKKEAEERERLNMMVRLRKYVASPVLQANETGRHYTSPWFQALDSVDQTHFGRLRAHRRPKLEISDPNGLERVSIDLQVRSLLEEVDDVVKQDVFVIDMHTGLFKQKGGVGVTVSDVTNSPWMEMRRIVMNIGEQIQRTPPPTTVVITGFTTT